MRLCGGALRLAAKMVTREDLPEPCGPEIPRKKGGELVAGFREMCSERRGKRNEVKIGVLSLITADMLEVKLCEAHLGSGGMWGLHVTGCSEAVRGT